MLDSCTNDVHFQYLCEFPPGPSYYASLRKTFEDIRLEPVSVPLRTPSVVCPGGHQTHDFLACDVQSDCWANKDVVLQTSPEAVTTPTSAWCNTSVTADELYFQCSSTNERIPFTLVCDFRKDCFDGSDEDFCVHPPCSLQYPVPCADSGQVCHQNSNKVTLPREINTVRFEISFLPTFASGSRLCLSTSLCIADPMYSQGYGKGCTTSQGHLDTGTHRQNLSAQKCP